MYKGIMYIPDFLIAVSRFECALKTKSSGNSWGTLGNVQGIKIKEMDIKATSMDFFDCLYGSSVARKDGEIIKCFGIYGHTIPNLKSHLGIRFHSRFLMNVMTMWVDLQMK